MFEKNMRIAFLLDFYRDVLDEHSASIMRAYYEDDLSLSEIATDAGISRQGVRHIIKKSEEQLEFLEERLGLAERFSVINSAAKELKKIADELMKTDSSVALRSAERIITEVKKITEENS